MAELPQYAPLVAALVALETTGRHIVAVVVKDAAVRKAAESAGARPPVMASNKALQDAIRSAIWPELDSLAQRLRLPWQEKVPREELAPLVAKLGGRVDEGIDSLMKDFWTKGDYAYRWRMIWVLGLAGTPHTRQILLDIALEKQDDRRPWARGAAREFANSVTDKAEAHKLLVSDDPAVLQQAAVALRGTALSKKTLPRLLELMKSPDFHLRRLVASALGADPQSAMAPEKVAAIVEALAALATMKEADKTAWPGNWTNAEAHRGAYVSALSQMKGADEALRQATAHAEEGQEVWRCVILARALRSEAGVRAQVRQIVTDPRAGMSRLTAVHALARLGDPSDLELLKRVAVTDPLQRERGGCRAPMNKEMCYPVREAASRSVELITNKGKDG